MFRTREFLGEGFREATYRVDSKPAHTVTASYGDNTASPLCDGSCKANDQSKPEMRLAAEMKGGSTLLLRLRTYRYQNLDLSFRIDGAQDAFEHILKGCAKLAAEKKS